MEILEVKLKEMGNRIRSNIALGRISYLRKKRVGKAIFEKIMALKLLELMKDIKPQIQET